MRGAAFVVLVLLVVPSLTVGALPGEALEADRDRGAKVHFVDDSGYAQYVTIQAAIDAASEGDEIRVFGGTYNETLVVGKRLRIIGNGSAETVIDGKWNGSVVSVTATGVQLERLSISNGGPANPGVDLRGVDNTTLVDCAIAGNRIGVRGDQGSDLNTLLRCVLVDNSKAGAWFVGDGNRLVGCSLRAGERGASLTGRDNVVENCTLLNLDVGVALGTPPGRVLLMGNSYTQANSLEAVLGKLLEARVPWPVTTRLSQGGLTLADHATWAQVQGHPWNNGLNGPSNKDHVVLQDQSQIPGFPTDDRNWNESLEGAIALNGMIEHVGAETVLMLTWGRRDGDSTNPTLYPDFTVMQERLEAGYRAYAENLSTPSRPVYIAPVGLAFKHIHDGIVASGGDPTLPGTLFHALYSSDGSHPSVAGSSLAAAVLYATLTGDSPVGLDDGLGLAEPRRLALQQAAAATVFNETPDYQYPWHSTTGCLVNGSAMRGCDTGVTLGPFADGNAVTHGSFANGVGLGATVMFGNCRDNSFHHNGFYRNNGSRVQVSDRGADDAWDDGAEGNWWSDYADRYPGATNDGRVWDTPYSIPAGAEDGFPLVIHPVFTDTEHPVADAGEDIRVDQGSLVTFSGVGSTDNYGITGYVWSFVYDGQNVSLSGPRPEFLFVTPGTYVVTLQVTDAAGHWDTDDLTVTVRDTESPRARIAEVQGPFLQNEPVTLDGSSSSDNVGVVNWTWMYRDGGAQVVVHGEVVTVSFKEAGEHLVRLTVVDGEGNVGTASTTVSVEDGEPPVARAGEDVVAQVGVPVFLHDNGSTDNVAIGRYRWTFVQGDETVWLEGRDAEFTFNSTGTYQVTLWVTDTAGLEGSDTITVTVLDEEPPRVVVGADRSVDQGTTVLLDGSGSSDNVGISGWTWSFTAGGVDRTLEGERASWTFDVPGTYEVTLTAVDEAGNEGSAAFILSVMDTEPPVAMPGPDRTVDMGTTVTLDASASTDNVAVTGYVWTFVYDGEEVHLFDPVEEFAFPIPGRYQIELRVRDAEGNVNASSFVLLVRDTEPPTAPSIRDHSVPLDEAVEFDGSGATDNVGVVNWTWLIEGEGGSIILEGERVVHRFTEPGDYRVTLVVEDLEGNAMATSFQVTVESSTVSVLPWLLVVAVVIVAVIGLAIYLRRDR